MTEISRILLFFLFFSCSCLAEPAQDIYTFNMPQQQQQFMTLLRQLRCLVCQNETLADSNAPLARDLRGQIAAMIQQGKNNSQIQHYLLTRYGDFIFYQPRLTRYTWILWLTPLISLLSGIFVLYLRKPRQ